MRRHNLFIGVMKRTYKILPFLILTLVILPAFLFAGQNRVIRVVDGDTIVVDYKGKYEKVRLLCINTPESVHTDKKQNIPIGKVASEGTKKWVAEILTIADHIHMFNHFSCSFFSPLFFGTAAFIVRAHIKNRKASVI